MAAKISLAFNILDKASGLGPLSYDLLGPILLFKSKVKKLSWKDQ